MPVGDVPLTLAVANVNPSVYFVGKYYLLYLFNLKSIKNNKLKKNSTFDEKKITVCCKQQSLISRERFS